MSVFGLVRDVLADQGPALALFTTALLFAGWVAGSFVRQHVDKQRWAELAVAACLVAVPLLAMPLPRPWAGAARVADVAVPVAPLVAPPAPMSAPVRGRPPAPAEPTAARVAGVDVAGSVAAGYLLVAAFLVLRLSAGLWRLYRIVRAATPLPAGALGVALPDGVTVRVGPRSVRPFCVGLRRFAIVIPEDLRGDPTLPSVLAHELAHIARRDPWSHWLFAAAAPVLYWHPLFWVLRARARLAAEIVTDAIACRGGSARDYARRLLDLVERDVARPVAPVGAVPVFRQRFELSRRIEMLIDTNHRPALRSRPVSLWLRRLGFTCTLAAAAVTFGAAPAQDPDRPWTKEERVRLLEKNKLLQEQLAALRARLAPDPAEKGGAALRTVTVRTGDSLAILARRHFGDERHWRRLLALNPGLDPKRLQPGDKIKVPARDPVAVREPEPVDVREPDPVAVPDPDRAAGRRPTPRPSASDPVRADAQDTLMLLDRLIDARTGMELAENRMKAVETANGGGAVDATAFEAAKIELAAARRRWGLVREFARLELEDARRVLELRLRELTETEKLSKRGFVPTSGVEQSSLRAQRAQNRLRMIESGLRN